jgi:hypothetical protein
MRIKSGKKCEIIKKSIKKIISNKTNSNEKIRIKPEK